MTSSKILVLNPLPSNLNKLLKKENALDLSNGPFDFVLLLGDVLNMTEVPQGLLPVTASTFFTEGVSLISSKLELEHLENNMDYLGKIGIRTMVNGLTLGYITGDLTSITQDQIDLVFEGHVVDILISYHWPTVISSELKLTLFGSSKIDHVVKLTKPRYHFACGSENGKFYERAPIFWKDDLRVTRFISLCQYGSKERFHYAFNLNSDSTTDLENSSMMEENPFLVVRKPVVEEVSTKRPLDDEQDDNIEPQRNTHKRVKAVVTLDQCFFCLSNPKIETHMIVSIGENCYLTIAKGPLTRPHKDLINFSGHGIIIPISHLPTLLSSKTAESVDSVLLTNLYKEIKNYKEAIVKMFKAINEDFNVVFFEVSKLKSIHYHIQFVPILSKYMSKFPNALTKLLQNNEKYPKNYKFHMERVVDDEDKILKIQDTEEYMLISIWESTSSQIDYISKIENIEGWLVDLQFPRRVLANVLNDHKRVYWDKCKQSKFRETEECENFKSKFKEFDFTLK